MKVENIGKYDNTDFEEPTYIGFCPKCGKMLRKARWGTDDECCGEYLEWDIENMDKRSLKEQQDEFWKELYFEWEDEE